MPRPSSDKPEKIIDISRVRVTCRDCSLYQLCLPLGIDGPDLERLEHIIKRRTPLARGDHLFRMGDPFRALYAVRSGSLKTYALSGDGGEQVTGFHLPGELAGLDAITTERHPCAAYALETTSICEIPFDSLEELAGEIPGLRRQLLRLMSREILADQGHLMLLGRKTAEERLATLLVSLSARLQARGFPAHEFRLSMSRADIGNYLGLAVETVSRLFSRFQEEGLLVVARKRVHIRDLDGLYRLAGLTRHLHPGSKVQV